MSATHPQSQLVKLHHIPLLMLGVLRANNVHVFASLSPHALAAITQLLDRAAHFHSADLLRAHELRERAGRLHAELLEGRCERLGLRAACERRA